MTAGISPLRGYVMRKNHSNKKSVCGGLGEFKLTHPMTAGISPLRGYVMRKNHFNKKSVCGGLGGIATPQRGSKGAGAPLRKNIKPLTLLRHAEKV